MFSLMLSKAPAHWQDVGVCECVRVCASVCMRVRVRVCVCVCVGTQRGWGFVWNATEHPSV